MAEEFAKRLEMMRKRQTYFSAIAEEYESFDEFIRTQKDWLEIFGIEPSQGNESYLSLRRHRWVNFANFLKNIKPVARNDTSLRYLCRKKILPL